MSHDLIIMYVFMCLREYKLSFPSVEVMCLITFTCMDFSVAYLWCHWHVIQFHFDKYQTGAWL